MPVCVCARVCVSVCVCEFLASAWASRSPWNKVRCSLCMVLYVLHICRRVRERESAVLDLN